MKNVEIKCLIIQKHLRKGVFHKMKLTIGNQSILVDCDYNRGTMHAAFSATSIMVCSSLVSGKKYISDHHSSYVVFSIVC